MGKIKGSKRLKERKKILLILSHGVFYRPCDTPAGKAGWIGEITFYANDRTPWFVKKDPIQARFDTKDEAEQFLKHKMYKLIQNKTITVRQYINETDINFTQTGRIPSVW